MRMKFSIRTAYVKDFESIRRLCTVPDTKFFGPSMRKKWSASLFFQDYVSHRMLIREQEANLSIIGYAEFNIFPKIHALSRECWTDWFNFHYCTQLPISISNTMFFEFFIFNSKFNPDLILSILHEFFLKESKVRFIITVQPPTCKYEHDIDIPYYEVLDDLSQVFYPTSFAVNNCINTQRVHIISREHIWANMRYRRALPEDNDDIVELIDPDFPYLREEWGDFYIAEHLLRNNECQHNTLIVAEINNTTVGFIWLNDHVNVMRLNKYYEVEMFGNLIRFDPTQPTAIEEMLVRKLHLRTEFFSKNTINDIIQVNVPEMDNKVVNTLKSELSAYTLSSSHQMNWNTDSETSDSAVTCPFDELFHRFYLLNSALRGTHHYLIELTEEVQIIYNTVDLDKVNVQPPVSIADKKKAIAEHRRMNRKAQGIAEEAEENAEDNDDNLNYPPDFNANVFALQLFGMHSSLNDQRAFQFLITAFSAFPKRDYCILSIDRSLPLTSKIKEMLKYFVQIVPRPNCPLDEKIYIVHRSTICGDLSLHPVEKEDLPKLRAILHSCNIYYDPPKVAPSTLPADDDIDSSISKLSEAEDSKHTSDRSSGIETNDTSQSTQSSDQQQYPPRIRYIESIMMRIYDLIKEDPFSDYIFYTIRCGNSAKSINENSIVGFIILRQFFHTQALHKFFKVHFDTQKPSFSAAEVIMLKLHPLLSYQSDMLFRELARISGSFDIFYFAPIKARIRGLPNDLVVNMQPIEPKPFKKVHYKPIELVRKRELLIPEIENINYEKGNFAAYQQNLLPSAFYGSSKKIVIYGFTLETRAFLRQIIFMWNGKNSTLPKTKCCLPRTNIVVIAKPGVMAAEYDNTFECEYCEDPADCWVNYEHCNTFLRDTTQRMDLRHYVRFVRARIREIDRNRNTIVLMNGCEIYYELLLLFCSSEFCIPKPMHPAAEMPPNYGHANTRLEKIITYHKVQMLIKEIRNPRDLKIVVHGGHLRTFAFINFLVTHGVDPWSIILVTPFEVIERDMGHNNPFNDGNIEMICQEIVEDLGIRIHSRLKFLYWVRYYEDDNLSEIVFQNYPDKKEVIIPCDYFMSFLEFNNDVRFVEVLKRAQIDLNEEKIIVDENYCTNDPRIFALGKYIKHRVEPNHQYTFVSPRESTAKLIHILKLDIEEPEEFEEKYNEACYFQSQLPLGYYMAKVCIPKRYMANHLNNTYSFSMTTYDKGNFVRVRLNEFDVVEEIACVTQKKMSFDHLQHFCGKHEALLNNMKSRYKAHEFTSFLDFFVEPWAELVMNENFPDLHRSIALTIKDKAESLVDAQQYDRETRKLLIRAYCKLETLESEFIQFVRTHRDEFLNDFVIPEDFKYYH